MLDDCLCNANFYKDGASCTSCPANSTSSQGSTSINDCVCNMGFVFIGGMCVLPPPTSTTNNASNIKPTSATLNGTVNDNGYSTTVSFRYSTDPGLAGATVVTADQSPLNANMGSTSVSKTIIGLIANTTYYFAVSGTNANGTVDGDIKMFTTPMFVIGFDSQHDLDFGDPCSCTDPLNCEIGGLTYFHDTLTINTTPLGVSGLKIGISGTASDFFIGNCGGLILANSVNMDSIPESPAGSATYKLEFWRPSGITPIVSVVESGTITMIPLATFQPICFMENCAPPIPTIGQWGLFVLAISIIIMAIVAIKSRESGWT